MIHKVRDAMRRVTEDGWHLVGTRGSHRQYEHPTKPGRVTIHGKEGDDITRRNWHSIMKQAGLDPRGR